LLITANFGLYPIGFFDFSSSSLLQRNALSSSLLLSNGLVLSLGFCCGTEFLIFGALLSCTICNDVVSKPIFVALLSCTIWDDVVSELVLFCIESILSLLLC